MVIVWAESWPGVRGQEVHLHSFNITTSGADRPSNHWPTCRLSAKQRQVYALISKAQCIFFNVWLHMDASISQD